MAILNVTDDSFYEASRCFSPEQALRRAEQALRDGATIIDVGGYSSRPGAKDISPQEEWRRVDIGIAAVRQFSQSVTVSVDTFRSYVVERVAQKWGDFIVNDISAAELDPQMIETVSRLGLRYIAMHMKGNPQDMQSRCQYDSIVDDVTGYLSSRAELLEQHGIARDKIILDPGFGFAKDLDQNYQLLSGLNRICNLGYRVLAGLSRKSMMYRPLGVGPQDVMPATQALQWECLRQGASILRVHDVMEACQTLALFELFEKNSQK